MTIDCFVVDDEQPAIDCLVGYIERVPILRLAGTANNALEAMDKLRGNEATLVFLDINMAGMNGLEMIKLVNNRVVFTTAHEHYALQSYDYERTIDYLLKPITFDRFQLSIKKVLNGIATTPPAKLPSTEYIDEDIFLVKMPNGKKGIPFTDIDFIKAGGYYSTIVCGKEKTVVPMSIKTFEQLLPNPQFIRVHKSYVINTAKIKKFQSDKVFLHSDIMIPIGRSYKPQW